MRIVRRTLLGQIPVVTKNLAIIDSETKSPEVWRTRERAQTIARGMRAVRPDYDNGERLHPGGLTEYNAVTPATEGRRGCRSPLYAFADGRSNIRE